VFFLSGCGIKMNNPVSTIAKALGLKGEISDFDVSSSSLKGGSSITIPFSISFSDGSEVSQIKLQFASDGMTFKDVDQVIDPSATSVTWPVPKGDFSQARLQLVVTSSAGKTSTQVSSVFSIDSTLPSAPSVSLVSSNPSNSPNASFTVSDCSDISWVYTSQSSNALSDLNSSLALSTLASDGWMECSTAAAAVNFTVSPNSGLKTIYFWAKDAAGNISTTSTVVTLTLDTSTPTASFSSPTTGSIITLADVTAFTMTGSCSAQGGSIKLSLSDGSETVSFTTTCNTSASPNWSIALNASTLSDTSSNGITAILVHTNPAGSSSSPQTRTFNKNTVTSELAVAITSPANGGFSNNLNDASFPISGTCSENGRTVSVSATDGSTTINDTPTCTLGAWSSNLDLTTLGTSITLDATHTNVGGSSVNATSVSITKDLINPNNAGSPAWVEASPSTTNTVTATWTKSNSGDLANQSLQYYSDGTCAAASGAPVSAALASTQAFTGTSGTWSYKIMSYDSAGNINTSACSTAILLKEASLAQSTLTLSPSSIVKGQISSLSLIIKDPSGVQNTLGGYTVTFSASAGAGVSAGTISSTTDNGNGTYTATFTGTAKGTAATITATITGLGAVTQTQNITVGNTAPVIIPLAASTYPLNTSTPPAIQGNSVTLATATDADSDTVTLNCTYQTLGLHASDPNYAAAGTNCTTLDTITTAGSPAVTVRSKMTSSTSGSLVWTPTSTQRGTYQFTISGTDGTANASTQTVNVAVRGAYTNTNLLSALDALNATNASGLSASTPSAPFTSAATAGSWLNLFSSASNGTLTFGTTNPWGGTGQSSTSAVDPYALTLNQANSDSLSLGTALSAATQFSTETWVKPSPLPSASPAAIIVGNGGGTGDGFVLRQSQITPDRAEFVVGQKYYSYKDLILSDKPIGYWRLNEASGTIAYDLTAYGRNAGYPASSITYGAAGVLAGDSDSSINITGDVTIFGPASVNPWGGNFSIEFWANPSSLAAAENMVMSKEVFSTNGFRIFANNVGRWVFSTAESGGSIVAQSGGGAASVGNWSHVVVTFDSTASRATIYVNGTQRSSTTGTFVVPAGGFRISSIGWYWLGKLDDVAVYDYTLASSQVTEHYQTGINGNYKAYPGNAILANKPTAYWRLGEKSGIIAYDSSGNGHDGTYTGVSLNQTGVLANDSDTATTFSGGTSSYLSTNASITFTGTSPFTASAWFKTSNGSNFPQLLNNSDNTDG
jgi:hypothetical protein